MINSNTDRTKIFEQICDERNIENDIHPPIIKTFQICIVKTKRYFLMMCYLYEGQQHIASYIPLFFIDDQKLHQEYIQYGGKM
jgi:hypothetical protein